MIYPSSNRETTVLHLAVWLIQAKNLVRFNVAKIMRRTNINANIDATITPAFEDVGSASMIEKKDQ